MLTLKLINERTEWVIKGLEKKHFSGAKEAIENVLATDKKRREAQTQLDINLSESKKLAAQIGALMKQGKKEEAESIKTEVARLKDTNKALQEAMDRAQQELTTLLCAIPNIPYDIVPEGNGAEDNVVVTMGGMETELPKDALPHWELAKKYNLIDFDLGVKNHGGGFPRLSRKRRTASTCPHQLLPRRGTQIRLRRNHASYGSQRSLRLRYRTVARQGRTDVPLQSG